MSRFILRHRKQIPELNTTLHQLVHEPTGARVLHLSNEDPENFFCISLRTDPPSSNGVPHILEHTTLCGSNRFPIKDPFFSMLRRSMQTFMNALTGQDFTCYPAASLVEKDFYNLLDVYIDSIFFPELKELSFLQEGWRLEFRKSDDPSSGLVYKGIVFNEMKGELQNPITRLWHTLLEKLMPETIYAFNSGGDPAVIPTLTLEALREFHASHYHPSRALFYFYGNLPLERHLEFLEQTLLHKITPLPPLPPLKQQTRFKKRVRTSSLYPFGQDPEGQSMLAVGVLTLPISHQEELLALHLLGQLLLDHDASPLKARLLASGLCKEVRYTLEKEMAEVPFVIICAGVDAKNVEALEQLLWKTLKEIVDNGFESKMIEASLHQMELSHSEITPHFGLNLFMRAGILWQHGINPQEGLHLHTLFACLREQLKNPRFLSDLLLKQIVDNPHQVILTLHPSKEVLQKEAEEERLRLESIKLTEPEKMKILQQTERLAQFQKTHDESKECLPKITLKDLRPDPEDFLLEEQQIGTTRCFSHATFTNGLTYGQIAFPLPDLTAEELPLLSLLVKFLPQMGTAGRTWQKQLELCYAQTGGFSAQLNCYTSVDFNRFLPLLSITGSTLDRNGESFLERLHEMTVGVDFLDVGRLWQLFEKQVCALEQSFTVNAMQYAQAASKSGFSLPAWLVEQWSGLTFYQFCQELRKTHTPEMLAQKLHNLQKKVVGVNGALLTLTATHSTLDKLLPLCDRFSYTKTTPVFNCQPILERKNLILPIESPVAFNTLTLGMPPASHPDTMAILVACRLFHNGVLHPKIREQGGAYGSGAQSQALTGTLTLFSYRDPHVKETLAIFKEALEWVQEHHFSQEELEEAQLQLFQMIDQPVAPGARALTALTWRLCDRTLAFRKKQREALFQITGEQVVHAVKTHLSSQWEKAVQVTLAGKELL